MKTLLLYHIKKYLQSDTLSRQTLSHSLRFLISDYYRLQKHALCSSAALFAYNNNIFILSFYQGGFQNGKPPDPIHSCHFRQGRIDDSQQLPSLIRSHSALVSQKHPCMHGCFCDIGFIFSPAWTYSFRRRRCFSSFLPPYTFRRLRPGRQRRRLLRHELQLCRI